ncbi:hypothetical protein HanHA89_Chr04g0157071 [Helianthus annuus]|nr:hypothetical protein HanHA89_Chr04g0157071 [Helianthus annuus]
MDPIYILYKYLGKIIGEVILYNFKIFYNIFYSIKYWTFKSPAPTNLDFESLTPLSFRSSSAIYYTLFMIKFIIG